MSVTSADRVIAFGPMVGLHWSDGGEGSPDQPPRRMWLERTVLDAIRQNLLPAIPPADSPPVAGGCWVWTGPMTSDGRPVLYRAFNQVPVRRLLYDLKNGPLPAREFLLPVCEVARCCNPDHMAPDFRGPVPRERLTPQQRRGFDVCLRGHALTPSNTYVLEGVKYCRTCRAENSRAYRSRQIKERGTRGPERRAPRR